MFRDVAAVRQEAAIAGSEIDPVQVEMAQHRQIGALRKVEEQLAYLDGGALLQQALREVRPYRRHALDYHPGFDKVELPRSEMQQLRGGAFRARCLQRQAFGCPPVCQPDVRRQEPCLNMPDILAPMGSEPQRQRDVLSGENR